MAKKYLLVGFLFLAGCKEPVSDVPDSKTSHVSSEWKHGSLECIAYRGKSDHSVENAEALLVEKGTGDFGQINYEASLGEMHFQVGYSENLNTLYTHMTRNGTSVYFATLRVPTENHNDSLADYTSDDGWRSYISCNFRKQ